MKELFRGKFIALTAYNRKEERSEINNLFHFRKLEKEEQIKSKGRRIKEIVRFRDEIENRKSTEKNQ